MNRSCNKTTSMLSPNEHTLFLVLVQKDRMISSSLLKMSPFLHNHTFFPLSKKLKTRKSWNLNTQPEASFHKLPYRNFFLFFLNPSCLKRSCLASSNVKCYHPGSYIYLFFVSKINVKCFSFVQLMRGRFRWNFGLSESAGDIKQLYLLSNVRAQI